MTATPTPEALQYTTDHEWVSLDGDVLTLGITAYAADQLGDIVYLDLPEEGADIAPGAPIGEIESTKSVGELLTPVAGTVLERNPEVETTPDLVNSDPYGAGWLLKVRVAAAPEGLLDAAAYEGLIAE